jgi:hypothetical protein
MDSLLPCPGINSISNACTDKGSNATIHVKHQQSVGRFRFSSLQLFMLHCRQVKKSVLYMHIYTHIY